MLLIVTPLLVGSYWKPVQATSLTDLCRLLQTECSKHKRPDVQQSKPCSLTLCSSGWTSPLIMAHDSWFVMIFVYIRNVSRARLDYRPWHAAGCSGGRWLSHFTGPLELACAELDGGKGCLWGMVHIDVGSKALWNSGIGSTCCWYGQELAGNPGECNSVASEAQLEVRNPNGPMKRCMV